MLYVVSTPIGNLEDISLRAIRILSEVDYIACEDTRHTGKLIENLKLRFNLQNWTNKGFNFTSSLKLWSTRQNWTNKEVQFTKLNQQKSKVESQQLKAESLKEEAWESEKIKELWSKNRFISFHSYSWDIKLDKILDLLKQWESVALVSDAGTPWISDPAYQLTKEARNLWIKIVPIPWPAAFLTALQASWVGINKFEYLGFAPTKKGRETFFKNLKDTKTTIVFYESVHRIQKCLEQICTFIWENRRVIVARELTKMFEEFFDWTAKEALEHFKNPKGEFVVILPIW